MKTKLSFALKKFTVDRARKQFRDLALITAGREATGHGIYIDDKTLASADAAAATKGGKLRAFVAHQSWVDQFLGEDRILEMPGYFDGIRVDGDRLVADTFTFYDSFAESEPEAFGRLIEMAEKTPELFGLSIEAWGHAVYVDTEGKEYSAEPEDTELQYEGMPAFRVTRLDAAAFVSEPAANDGLFAAAFGKLFGGKERRREKLFSELFAPLMEWQKNQLSETLAHLRLAAAETGGGENHQSHQSKQQPEMKTMKELIKALKARYADDKERLQKALSVVADHDDPDTLTVDEIERMLDAAEVRELRAQLAQREAAAAQADEEKRKAEAAAEANRVKYEAIRESGSLKEVSLSVPVAPHLARYSGRTAQVLEHLHARGEIKGDFAVTNIGNLWVPDIWVTGMPEMVIRQTDILTSGVVVTDPELNRLASGGGDKVNMPNLREPQVADSIQIEGTRPPANNVASGREVAAILNRAVSIGQTSLSGAVSQTDPVGFALGVIARLRLRNRLVTLLSQLQGLFADSDGAFSPLAERSFVEASGDVTSAHLLDSDLFIDALARFGEAKSKVETGGAILMHSMVEAALTKQDSIDYIRDSDGRILLRVYKGIPIFLNDSLVRDGTGGSPSKVYTTYVFAPRAVGMGDKPQIAGGEELAGTPDAVASLLVKGDAALNNREIFDRTRSIIHPLGARWVGSPAGQSATNAELATKANWELAFADIKNVGIVQIQTNG